MFKTAHPNYPKSFTIGDKRFEPSKAIFSVRFMRVKTKKPVLVLDYIHMNMENHYGFQVGVLGVVIYANLCWIK